MKTYEYNYEVLLDQHFQKLCQALIANEYPSFKAFPVGMPDGGRDATAMLDDGDSIVFQVKFARDPAGISDYTKWVTDAIDGEADKIQRLAERGAKRYILITNLQGSSHKDVGTIDRVQQHLDDTLSIPAECWWRDDLDTRLHNKFDLKLRYPALLSGVDAVRAVLNDLFGAEDERRRKRTLDAYLRAQYDLDESVRFKQADLLPSPLFELYVDVPIGPAGPSRPDEFGTVTVTPETDDEPDAAARETFLWVRGEMEPLYSRGAATYLLNDRFSKVAPVVSIEGAPGQGKSTLAQYLVQVHRARYLGTDDARLIPSGHAEAAFRLPFKLELRDLAAWLKGENPWAPDELRPTSSVPSLEGALAYHIFHYSGGAPFSIDDLLAVANKTPILLVLDALDEVPDLDDRRAVVEAVQLGVGRLQSNCSSLQVVATSRPTALANAARFPRRLFRRFELADIDSELAFDYLERWAKVRRLKARDVAEIRQTLASKLDQPHMADLARNAMQLSILLSLIQARGESLPDKRTELYDTYIDVFLNRESEKSEVVRKNRSAIVDFHRYLAYFMHAAAEQRRTNGRIKAESLKSLLREFLRSEGHAEELVDSIFRGIVERIVALVSRVEGTYEFEVQPLREYFAARFLYDTAPYSPPGREMPGTKPDRFDAIAPNAYWLNVTRFFAGCYSKGELADLAERLEQLIESSDLRYTNYPRDLTTALLQDWVFTQAKPAIRRLVLNAFDGLGIRATGPQLAMLSKNRYSRRRAAVILSSGAGREVLVEHLIDVLAEDQNCTDRTRDAARLLGVNAPATEIRSKLSAKAGDDVTSQAYWAQVASWSSGFTSAPVQDLRRDFKKFSAAEPSRFISMCLRGSASFVTAPKQDLRTVMAVLAVEAHYTSRRVARDSVHALSVSLDPSQGYALVAGRNNEMTFGLLRNVVRKSRFEGQELGPAAVALAQVLLEEDRGSWSTSLAPWTKMTDTITDVLGRCWIAHRWAAMSAGVRSASERGRGAGSLFSSDAPLTERARAARMRRGNASWWLKQLEESSDTIDRMYWLHLLGGWASPSTVEALIPAVNDCVAAIDPYSLDVLSEAMLRLDPRERSSPRSTEQLALEPWRHASTESLIVLARIMYPVQRTVLLERWQNSSGDARGQALASAGMLAVATAFRYGDMSWPEVCSLVRELHEAGGSAGALRYSLRRQAAELDRETARMILSDPWRYPSVLIEIAEAQESQSIERRKSVSEIAERDRWFVEI